MLSKVNLTDINYVSLMKYIFSTNVNLNVIFSVNIAFIFGEQNFLNIFFFWAHRSSFDVIKQNVLTISYAIPTWKTQSVQTLR